MIEFRSVTKKYKNNIGLNNVSVKIDAGEWCFLIGESGAGKTTFIKLIQKEIEPDEGRIFLAGKDITHIRKRERPIIRQKIGMVFQDFRLLEKKTAYENVSFALEIRRTNKKEIDRRVRAVLESVGLGEKGDMFPSELSAGEQQRVGIARAIVNNPQVLIADEPTANLDHKTAKEIIEILERINEQQGTTILIATHALDIIKGMNKRVITIDKGSIVDDRIGLCDPSGMLSEAKYIEELVEMFAYSGSLLTSQERRTIYTTSKPVDYENVGDLLEEYLDKETSHGRER